MAVVIEPNRPAKSPACLVWGGHGKVDFRLYSAVVSRQYRFQDRAADGPGLVRDGMAIIPESPGVHIANLESGPYGGCPGESGLVKSRTDWRSPAARPRFPLFAPPPRGRRCQERFPNIPLAGARRTRLPLWPFDDARQAGVCLSGSFIYEPGPGCGPGWFQSPRAHLSALGIQVREQSTRSARPA